MTEVTKVSAKAKKVAVDNVKAFMTRPDKKTPSPLEVLIKERFNLFVSIADKILYNRTQAKEIAFDSIAKFTDLLISDASMFDFERTKPVNYLCRIVRNDTLKYIRNGKKLVYATSLTSDSETENLEFFAQIEDVTNEDHDLALEFATTETFKKWLKSKVYESDYKVFNLLTKGVTETAKIAFILGIDANNVSQCRNRVKKAISLRAEFQSFKVKTNNVQKSTYKNVQKDKYIMAEVWQTYNAQR